MPIKLISRQPLPQTASSRVVIESSQRTAFTLIELLVVISIIVLLVAILLPALGSARVASQRTVSVSSIRQITLAQHMYANNFKSSLPFLKQKHLNADGTVNTSDRWQAPWSRMLITMGYLTSTNIYWSPGRARSLATGFEDERSEFMGDPRPTPYSYESVGYGMNIGVAGGNENNIILGSAPPPLRLGDSQAPPPSNMLLLVETWSTSGINTTTPVGSINGYLSVGADRYNRSTTSRLFNYQGGIVRSYVDGRAHAIASQSTGGILISGHPAHVGNPAIAQTDPNEIGWDIHRAPQSVFLEGAYAGNWSLAHFDDRDHNAPWYRDWRTEWYSGLR